MIPEIINTKTLKENFRHYADTVQEGQDVIIFRKNDRGDVVLISKSRYNYFLDLEKRNNLNK
ncbi:hypothetical protein HMPREF9628_02211 [Peptoanaerobacter stomatis]|jgi:phd_YefM|uniref:Antitoxin n=1 Tax=Peptoanaerobacter stomatis TaxID=796937 RepID=G9XF58_9FIRM|nr:hypothetical protein [Peptoanaerobacter stomatis]EHL17552.1 hypothetical protein HMPREF9628_02211 [Peptoanaerobacter stomatis]